MRVLRRVLPVVLVVLVLSLGVLPLTAHASATTVLATRGLNLRAGASLSAPVILVLRYGETVYPLGAAVWSDGISWLWVRVYRWGYHWEGYCASAYLGGYPGYVPSTVHGLMVTAPSGLNLRTGPGTWYAVNRTVPYGAILQPTGYSVWGGGLLWQRVLVGGMYLWGASMYLTAV